MKFIAGYFLVILCLTLTNCAPKTSAIQEISIRNSGSNYYGLKFFNEKVFRKNLTAEKTVSETRIVEPYPKIVEIKYRGTITEQQFEQLAQALFKNNFFSKQNIEETVYDGGQDYIKVTHSDGVKDLQTSSVDKETNAVKAVIKNLDEQIKWEKVE